MKAMDDTGDDQQNGRRKWQNDNKRKFYKESEIHKVFTK